MFVGVIVFSFLGGTFATYLETKDEMEAASKEQIGTKIRINRIKDTFGLSQTETEEFSWIVLGSSQDQIVSDVSFIDEATENNKRLRNRMLAKVFKKCKRFQFYRGLKIKLEDKHQFLLWLFARVKPK